MNDYWSWRRSRSLPSTERVATVQLGRGSIVMSRASFAALQPDMIDRMEQKYDIVIAEDALAELDNEET